MAQHIAELQQALEGSGLSREEALYAARKQFGNTGSLQEQSRDIWARNFFPGQNPIGKHITYSTHRITCEIVGVVGTVRASVSDAAVETEIYLPLS